MICNNSQQIKEKTAYVVANLVTYYDRYLENYESMVVESIGVNRKMVKVITKVIPIFQYFSYNFVKRPFKSSS